MNGLSIEHNTVALGTLSALGTIAMDMEDAEEIRQLIYKRMADLTEEIARERPLDAIGMLLEIKKEDPRLYNRLQEFVAKSNRGES